MRTLLILGRTSNLPTVWTNVLVGWFLCGGGWTIELVGLLGGISLLYLAGMTLNDAFDARWDRNHASQRPIPSGVISERAVWGAGLVELALGVTIVLLATSAHLSLVVALVAAIFLYNWLHKKWAGSVLIMGLCRALVYVSAGSAVVSQTTAIEVAPAVWIVAVAMILYIAGITLAARSEHLEKAPALGLLNRLLLTLPVLFPLFGSRTVPASGLTLALTVTGVVAIWAWIVIIRTTMREHVPKGVTYAIAGIALYDAAIVAYADWRAAIVCLCAFVLTLFAQRVIPAT